MITATLQQQIIQQLNQHTHCNNWMISGDTIEARKCIVYKLTCPSHPHAIALKVYRDRQPQKHQVMPQYTVLERLAPLMNHDASEYRVPQVYGSYPEQGLFLMEWVSAPPLAWHLWRYCYSKTIQQQTIRRTFGWLQHFHQAAELSQHPVNIQRYPDRLQQFRVKHDGAVLMESNSTFLTGMECIQTLAEQFNGLRCPHARAHGDFTPANILLDKQAVTAIDITGSQLLPVVEDLSLQLSYIAINYPNMLTRADMKQPPEHWPLLTVILDAYDFPTEEEQRRLLLYVLLYQLLRRWLVIAHRNRKRRIPMLERWRLRNSAMIVGGVSRALLQTCHLRDSRP